MTGFQKQQEGGNEMVRNYLPNDFPELAGAIDRVPVDLQAICTRLGIEVHGAKLEAGISGKLLPNSRLPEGLKGGSSGWSIMVNEKETYERRRFTVAHELGHFFIHRREAEEQGGICDDVFHRSNQVSDYMEREANRFAANLLMPWDRVNEYLKELGTNPLNLQEMADEFEVSTIAMAIRIGVDA